MLAEGLLPFVEQHMSAAAPVGADWLAMLSAREEAKFGTVKNLSKTICNYSYEC